MIPLNYVRLMLARRRTHCNTTKRNVGSMSQVGICAKQKMALFTVLYLYTSAGVPSRPIQVKAAESSRPASEAYIMHLASKHEHW